MKNPIFSAFMELIRRMASALKGEPFDHDADGIVDEHEPGWQWNEEPFVFVGWLDAYFDNLVSWFTGEDEIPGATTGRKHRFYAKVQDQWAKDYPGAEPLKRWQLRAAKNHAEFVVRSAQAAAKR